MFKASIQVNRPIKVLVNSQRQNWAQIKCEQTGVILHTGRVPYIQRVAKQRYNHSIKLPR